MQLLASVQKRQGDKHPLYVLDTKTKTTKPLPLPLPRKQLEGRALSRGEGVIVVSLGAVNGPDSFICLLHPEDLGVASFYELEKTIHIGPVTAFVPGMLYAISNVANQMIRVNYRPADLAVLSEQVVHTFDPPRQLDGLIYHRSYFLASDQSSQQVIRFRPNNGTEVVPAKSDPGHLGVSRDGLFFYTRPKHKSLVLGDLEVALPFTPTAVADDRYEGGLWVAMVRPDGQPVMQLVDYNGNPGDLLLLLEPGAMITDLVAAEVQ